MILFFFFFFNLKVIWGIGFSWCGPLDQHSLDHWTMGPNLCLMVSHILFTTILYNLWKTGKLTSMLFCFNWKDCSSVDWICYRIGYHFTISWEVHVPLFSQVFSTFSGTLNWQIILSFHCLIKYFVLFSRLEILVKFLNACERDWMFQNLNVT